MGPPNPILITEAPFYLLESPSPSRNALQREGRLVRYSLRRAGAASRDKEHMLVQSSSECCDEGMVRVARS